MNSHNTKPVFDYHKTPVVSDDDKQDTAVVSKSLTKNSGLAIAEDAEIACDPYNSTGKHVILKAKRLRED